MTRDLIQGFIDGYITAGGDPASIDSSVDQYVKNHPTYKVDESVIASIKKDIATYRLSLQAELAPVSVPTVPIPVPKEIGQLQ